MTNDQAYPIFTYATTGRAHRWLALWLALGLALGLATALWAQTEENGRAVTLPQAVRLASNSLA
ncbi:MAG: hypothetical protein ACOYNY_45045, partial [Caldilineaceae bacterium]